MNPAYDIQRVNTSQFQQGMESQYQSQSNALKTDHSMESQHAQDRQAIEQKGKTLGLNEEKFQTTPVKKDVEEQHTRADESLKNRQRDHAEKVTPLQEKVNTARDGNIIWDNMKQTWKSGSEAAVDGYNHLDKLHRNFPRPPEKKE